MKVPCKNCGEPTNLGNAVPERSKMGWCNPCYTYWSKHRRVNNSTGKEFWVENKSYVQPKPFVCRGGASAEE